MIPRRSLIALNSAERQEIRVRWLQGGQSSRSFHSSRRQDANPSESSAQREGSPAIGQEGSISPAPSKPRLSRQQRAAMILNEVSMLQRGPPPGTQNIDPRPPTVSAGFLQTPDASGAGRMGENESAGREGPNAQGVGRTSGSDENVYNEHPRVQGTRPPHEVQEPAEGGVNVLEASTPGAPPVDRAEPSGAQRQKSTEDLGSRSNWERNTLRRMLRGATFGTAIVPKALSHDDLLRSGDSARTPAGNGFASMVIDRFKDTADPARQGIVTERIPGFKTLRKMKRIVATMVAGKYGKYNLFSMGEKYVHPSLNQVARSTTLNSTYLKSDGKRILEKVKMLLPPEESVKEIARKRKHQEWQKNRALQMKKKRPQQQQEEQQQEKEKEEVVVNA